MQTVQKERLVGQGAILLTAIFWSTSGILIKLIDWHPIVITCLRSFIAALFLFAARLIAPPAGSVKTKPTVLWASALIFTFTMITFIIANKLTNSANVIMLQYSAPVWAALLGWVLIKEKPHWEHWGALVLVFGGLILFFRDGLGSGAIIGDALSLVSGIFLGLYSVSMRMMKDGNPRDAMLLGHVITTVICLPFIFLYPPSPKAISVIAIILLGTVQIGIASLLFSYGIKRISAVQAMLTATAEPILNPVWVFAITGEKPALTALAGGAIILTAVLSSSFIGMRRDAGT
ncbi:MAG: DMT family transporter [Treponema sp.]|nr:DMT family transporter [Treponema sp.]